MRDGVPLSFLVWFLKAGHRSPAALIRLVPKPLAILGLDVGTLAELTLDCIVVSSVVDNEIGLAH